MANKLSYFLTLKWYKRTKIILWIASNMILPLIILHIATPEHTIDTPEIIGDAVTVSFDQNAPPVSESSSHTIFIFNSHIRVSKYDLSILIVSYIFVGAFVLLEIIMEIVKNELIKLERSRNIDTTSEIYTLGAKSILILLCMIGLLTIYTGSLFFSGRVLFLKEFDNIEYLFIFICAMNWISYILNQNFEVRDK